MKRSTDRILTTHTGSLPRPADLVEMIRGNESGKPAKEAAFDAMEEICELVSGSADED